MQGLFKFQHSQPPSLPNGCWPLRPSIGAAWQSAAGRSCIMSCIDVRSMELDLWLLLFLSGTTGQLSGAQHGDRIHHHQAVPSYRIWNQPQQRAGQGGEWADLHTCAHRWARLPITGQGGTPDEDLGPTEVILANSGDIGSGLGMGGCPPGCSLDSHCYAKQFAKFLPWSFSVTLGV